MKIGLKKHIHSPTVISLPSMPNKGEVLKISIRVGYDEVCEHTIKVRKNSSKKSIARSFNKFFKLYNHPAKFLTT